MTSGAWCPGSRPTASHGNGTIFFQSLEMLLCLPYRLSGWTIVQLNYTLTNIPLSEASSTEKEKWHKMQWCTNKLNQRNHYKLTIHLQPSDRLLHQSIQITFFATETSRTIESHINTGHPEYRRNQSFFSETRTLDHTKKADAIGMGGCRKALD